jgi:Protein of unknown function (DUF3833)
MEAIMKLLATLIGCLMFFTACTPKVTDYTNNQPKLDIREYLNGKVTAHGVIFNWRGEASRHFTADIVGTWQGNSGTLDETFTYSDGTTEKRIWKIEFTNDNHFTGTAGDVVGISQGMQYGNALNMKYVLALKDPDTHVTIDDWMYLTAQGVLINQSKILKFGLPVGKVAIAFTKDPTPPTTATP